MSDMPIQHQIMQTAARFECETGKRPHNIYLGHEQYRQLRDYAAVTFYHMLPNKVEAELSRPEFMGMKLFSVDSESHLAVSL